MPEKKNYWTQQCSDGKRESKREAATRASKVNDTQANAWSYSKQSAAKTKGGAFLKAAMESSVSATPTARSRICQRAKV